ncbi:MAG TPA: universal stress protein [Frankiaceae bacterium]|nr:universal stress protein [Frankiaceae bacterium]
MEILVGIDGTQHGLAATRWAAREARTVDMPLTLLHVYSVPAVPSPAGPVRMPDQRQAAKRAADAVMRRAEHVAREELEGSSVSLSTEVLEGPPISTLLEMSSGARLLVLGAHSGAIFHHRLGSVVGTCLHKATCPVVVVPVEVVAGAGEQLAGANAPSGT